MTLSDNRRKQQRTGVPPEIVKDFTIDLYKDGNKVLTKTTHGNILRLCRIDFNKTECDTVKITFKTTNGCNRIKVFEVRIY